MIAKTLAAIAAALLICTSAANANLAKWLIQGQITIVDGNVAPDINVGDPFSFVLNFDSDTPVSNPVVCGLGGVGTICRHNGDPTMYFSNVVVDGIARGSFDPNPPGSSSIIVRNNAALGLDTVDGYSFGSSEIYDFGARIASFGVIFRGPEDLSVVTDGRILPAAPPINLLALGTHLFQYCDGDADAGISVNCDNQFVEGNLTSVTAVPEPATLALLALGMAGLALKRSRKTH